MPAVKKAFDLKGVGIVELSTENEFLKNTIISCDQTSSEKPKARLVKPCDDENIANLIMSRMQKQMKNNK